MLWTISDELTMDITMMKLEHIIMGFLNYCTNYDNTSASTNVLYIIKQGNSWPCSHVVSVQKYS